MLKTVRSVLELFRNPECSARLRGPALVKDRLGQEKMKLRHFQCLIQGRQGATVQHFAKLGDHRWGLSQLR